MPRFRKKYQDRDKFMAFCRECPRYDSLWSCPPLSFDVDTFLEPYTWINVLCAKICLDAETIRTADTAEKIKTIGWDIVSAVKLDTDERLRKPEAQVPENLSLSSGGCNLGKSCTRNRALTISRILTHLRRQDFLMALCFAQKPPTDNHRYATLSEMAIHSSR